MKHRKKTTIEQRSSDLSFAVHYLVLRIILVIVATAGLALSFAALTDPVTVGGLQSAVLRFVALVAIVLARLLLQRNGKKWLRERDGK